MNAALLRKAAEQNSEYRERLAGLRHRCIELYTPNGFTFHHGLFSGMRFLLMKREFLCLIWRRRSLFSTAVQACSYVCHTCAEICLQQVRHLQDQLLSWLQVTKEIKRYIYILQESCSSCSLVPRPSVRARPGNEATLHAAITSYQRLEARCQATEQCIAFTSGGEFKTSVLPPQQWSDSTQDLYVAGMYTLACLSNSSSQLPCRCQYVCCRPTQMWTTQSLSLIRFYKCFILVYRLGWRLSSDIPVGPGTYDCECEHGYQRLGRYCVESYIEEQPSTSEQDWILSDFIDGVDWKALVEGRDFVFFPRMDSPGGDYLVVGKEADVEEACRATHHCLAYNTNGILKHSLQPPQQWVQWTDNPEHGLYVLDIDYCQMGLEQCPTNSQCVRSSPGNFSCQCVPPYQPNKAEGCEMLPEEVREAAPHSHLSSLTWHHMVYSHVLTSRSLLFCHWTNIIWKECQLSFSHYCNTHQKQTS